jgi:hypothetical protein
MSSPTSKLMQTSISHHGKGGGSEPLLRPFEWHELVRGLVSTAEENLWSSSGTKARAFLLKTRIAGGHDSRRPVGLLAEGREDRGRLR